MNPVSPSSGSNRARLVLVLTLLIALFFVTGCGNSGGGSGDKLRLSNARGSISSDVTLINLCNGLGFPSAFVFTADYEGDLNVGDRVFVTERFLPSGGSLSQNYLIGTSAGSALTPRDVSVFDCYIANSDTALRVEFYFITADGIGSNTVSDTFNI